MHSLIQTYINTYPITGTESPKEFPGNKVSISDVQVRFLPSIAKHNDVTIDNYTYDVYMYTCRNAPEAYKSVKIYKYYDTQGSLNESERHSLTLYTIPSKAL